MSIINRLRSVLDHPLNRDRKAAALIRYFKWQAGIRLVPGAVVFDWVQGAKFMVSKGEETLTGNVYCGLTEFADMCFLLHALRPSDQFADVGANLGSYTILACAAVGARGVAFEPVPASHGRLLENIRLNGMEDRVRVVNMAIGEAPGEVAFTTGHSAMNHIVADGEWERGDIMVEVSTLDLALAGDAPAIMKIDVEGFETPALCGAVETLNKESLLAVIIELDGHGERYGYDEDKIVGIMAGHGFYPHSYDPFSRALERIEGRNPDSLNTIFVSDEKALRERLSDGPEIHVHGKRI